ncbi:hypothetical protein T05_9101 [Trichinella murrelli]|uniref:Uncharacterized protein n=1 Tax=Trichinella murrelli TaxID=144512 RepID=A0A0V0SY86_9BILA|nr:hypothetical protein T05_9101 [Trichinella murrelli]
MAFKALVILVAYCLYTSWQIVYIFIEFLMSFANLQIVLIGRIEQCISPVPIASRHLSSGALVRLTYVASGSVGKCCLSTRR